MHSSVTIRSNMTNAKKIKTKYQQGAKKESFKEIRLKIKLRQKFLVVFCFRVLLLPSFVRHKILLFLQWGNKKKVKVIISTTQR